MEKINVTDYYDIRNNKKGFRLAGSPFPAGPPSCGLFSLFYFI
jgi:hypothetical protein